MKCKDCKFWKEHRKEKEKGWGNCTSDKICFGDPIDDWFHNVDNPQSDELYYHDHEMYSGAAIYIGEDFGCIHFTPKEM